MVYTSYFGKIKEIRKNFPSMVLFSIAGKTPKWFYDIPQCFQIKYLAPKWEWWKEWHDKFKDDYNSKESIGWYSEHYKQTVLNSIEPSAVIRMMENISNQNDICMLCYETPEEFCYRHLVCEWLNQNKIQCKELEF